MSAALSKLDEWEALAEKASPAPWYVDGREVKCEGAWHTVAEVSGSVRNPEAVADRAFIAASRQGWPATMRALRKALEGLTCMDRYDACGGVCPPCAARAAALNELEGVKA